MTLNHKKDQHLLCLKRLNKCNQFMNIDFFLDFLLTKTNS